jgi:hypothetical protein
MDNQLRKYDASGAMFQVQKKSPKAPDYTGQLEISDEVFEDLIKQYKANKELSEDKRPYLKINLVGWRKVAQSTGRPFLSVLGNKFEEYVPQNKKAEQTQEVKTSEAPKSEELPTDLM